ncbi:MAG TPA: PhzF family phenazine biosynthesis protein [Candidatus Sulfotelmatobacter sp.]
MPVSLFHVNAFTDKDFAGNPAAVCPLNAWLDDNLLLAIAAENSLSETAYFVPEADHFRLRWFTPQCEVNLCGHATLASAFVLLTLFDPQNESVHFETRSGTLTVRREGDLFAMDFPALPPWTCEIPPGELTSGLRGTSRAPETVLQLKDNYFVVYEHEDDILSIRPNFRELEKLHPAGVAVTAPGKNSDFVSRYFAPSYGIPEDPVTGSTHCSLTPYWAQRLGKNTLHARQVSERGGELWCEVAGDRVIIKGKAVLTLRGTLLLG